MFKLTPDKDTVSKKISIQSGDEKRKIPALVVHSKDLDSSKKAPGVLWIHGGGLCAALCMMARDKGKVKIAYQLPLYPMIDNFDTESSINNHGKVWNTKLNHFGWKMYLRKDNHKEVSPYAAASRQTDYSNLPPAYTFVGTGEPFYCETLKFVENLKAAGVEATVDVYESNMHAFDMLKLNSELGKQAAQKFNEQLEKWLCK